MMMLILELHGLSNVREVTVEPKTTQVRIRTKTDEIAGEARKTRTSLNRSSTLPIFASGH